MPKRSAKNLVPALVLLAEYWPPCEILRDVFAINYTSNAHFAVAFPGAKQHSSCVVSTELSSGVVLTCPASVNP